MVQWEGSKLLLLFEGSQHCITRRGKLIQIYYKEPSLIIKCPGLSRFRFLFRNRQPSAYDIRVTLLNLRIWPFTIVLRDCGDCFVAINRQSINLSNVGVALTLINWDFSSVQIILHISQLNCYQDMITVDVANFLMFFNVTFLFAGSTGASKFHTKWPANVYKGKDVLMTILISCCWNSECFCKALLKTLFSNIHYVTAKEIIYLLIHSSIHPSTHPSIHYRHCKWFQMRVKGKVKWLKFPVGTSFDFAYCSNSRFLFQKKNKLKFKKFVGRYSSWI